MPLTDNLRDATGRQKLLARLGPEANDPLDEFLNLTLTYEQNNTPSLQGFLHWLASGEAKLKREQDQGEGQVQVMTVHGSKGLDSHIVFLPDTCRLPDKRQDDMILAPDDDIMLWRPGRQGEQDTQTSDWREAYHATKFAEHHRLLYVAATRARDRLYIAGYQGQREPDPMSWYHRAECALKPLMNEAKRWDGEVIWQLASPQTADPECGEHQDARSDTVFNSPKWLFEAPEPEAPLQQPLAPSRLPLAQSGEVAPSALSPLAAGGDDRFLRGRLIHKLLEVLPTLRRMSGKRRHCATSRGMGPIWRTQIGVACSWKRSRS